MLARGRAWPRRAARRADRQGHAHFRLHARSGARSGACPRPASTCMLSGPLPTPAVAYLTRALRLSAGIVISASHNPFDDNGIKFFSGDGAKLPDAVETGDRSASSTSRSQCVRVGRSSARRAASTTRPAATSSSARARFPTSSTCAACSIVVDCAHGAAYHVAPHVFHELGADVDRDRRPSPTASTSTQASAPRIPQALQRSSARAQAPISASRSMATATGCSWSTATGATLRRRPAALRDRARTASGAARCAAASSAR